MIVWFSATLSPSGRTSSSEQDPEQDLTLLLTVQPQLLSSVGQKLLNNYIQKEEVLLS